MTTGEGGMIVFRDEEPASRARLLRSHGMTTLTWDRHRGHASTYDVMEVGFNYRIDELRAALGRSQIARLDALNARRTELVSRYAANLADTDVEVPTLGGRGTSANHLFVVLMRSPAKRDQAREHLKAHGIQSSVHYPPIHTFSRFRSEETSLPVAEEIAARVLTLPLHPGLSYDDVDTVCHTLLSA
jgi:dTDP-4-amino-4,6-dideoxygalactose transaminase